MARKRKCADRHGRLPRLLSSISGVDADGCCCNLLAGLPTGLPFVVDIWPRHEASRCWADMTRTFVVGKPAPEHADLIAEHARVVRTALERAKAAIRPGISGGEIFDLACDLFESEGHLTQRTAQREGEVEGFQSWLGHGVGLDVHESPGPLRPDSPGTLRPPIQWLILFTPVVSSAGLVASSVISTSS